MPSRLIEFSKFAHPQRWWLRRGPPPWLDDERWFARAFRVSLVLGLMGTASGWLTAIFVGLVTPINGRNHDALRLGLFLCHGSLFGAVTLIPLSRWLNRGWLFTLLAVPASLFACLCSLFKWLTINPIMQKAPDWVPGGQHASGFYVGFVGAAMVAIWMGHPRHKSAWLAVGLAALLASLGFGVIVLIDPHAWLIGQPTRLMIGLLYSTVLGLTAVGLGARLWWPAESVSGGENVKELS